MKCLMLVALLLGACVPPLQVHDRMGKLSHEALQQCKQTAARCPAMLLCQGAAQLAGEAMQDARKLIAEGHEDADLTARATVLPPMAEAGCKAAGVRVPK